MSCIKFLGKCMCPWYLLLKEKVQLVGSKSDMQNWIKFAQVDSKPCQFDIEQVRQLLFERGLSLTSKAVKAILDPISAVPTQVCSLFFPLLANFYTFHRMPSLNVFSIFLSIFIVYLLLISCMRLRLVIGKLFSFTSLKFSMHMEMIQSKLWTLGTYLHILPLFMDLFQIGIDKSHHLAMPLSGNLEKMCQEWRSWQQETSRTFFRCQILFLYTF